MIRPMGLPRAEHIGHLVDEEAQRQGLNWSHVDFDQLYQDVEERVREQEARDSLERGPGWRSPDDPTRIPIRAEEAVTFTTEWGPVTLGRSLARIYDMEGWPDAATLETMARQQAAREAVPA